MSDTLQNSLTFAATTLGLWLSLEILVAATKLFSHIRFIFTKSEDEKLLKDLIDALNKPPKEGE
jgi:hypothetical protein